ncbi:methylmalonyl-CoA mutase [Candidatus Vecturithrix granuli]|uniref:methylmalonyl-CoA mutase n=1 Tax=Vecturithrix granuli TaxID=1499967 RepID=A0A081BYV1_VECG1|nr:methylmalonyl-CoA mutase [Candidatus Vecturithrix granuli]
MSSDRQHTDQSAAGGQPRLLSEFPYPTYEEWYDEAVKLLKGAPFEKKMLTKTYEGITLQPIYTQKDVEGRPHIESLPGFAPYLRGNTAGGYQEQPWQIAQEISCATPREVNAALQNDMQRGQTAVNLVFDRASQQGFDPDHARREEIGQGGASVATLEDLKTILEGIDLEDTPIFIQAGIASVSAIALLAALAQTSQKAFGKLQGGVVNDPLGVLASEGTLPYSIDTAYKKMAAATNWAVNQAPQFKTIGAQGALYHNSGANAVQELAFTIATGVEYLRAMQHAGLSVNDVAPRMFFVFGVGTHYFMEIAKLRAARVLWTKIVKAFDGNAEAQKMTIHVRTSSWNTTVYDPYVNMLRTTVESFASVVGGCDSMHIGAFDEPIRPPDEFSRRIARNTHLILKEETHLDKTIDPAGGSWYVESLTDELARKAWAAFQEIEKQGGMACAVQAGIPQQESEQIAQQRKANLGTRKDVLIGTNMYPNLDEKPLEARDIDAAVQKARADEVARYRITQGGNAASLLAEKLPKLLQSSPGGVMPMLIEAVASGATLGELEKSSIPAGDSGISVKPVTIHRGAEMFETLRKAAEAYAARTGARPKIFMANMGPIPQHKARADFSIGFFEVGGFEMLKNDGFPTVDEAANAALASGAPAVIICSTDETYPEIVPVLTQKIKTAKPETIMILAGYPQEHVEAFKQAGIDEFIHIRANLHDIVANLMNKLGILA